MGNLWQKGSSGMDARRCVGVLSFAQDDSKNKQRQRAAYISDGLEAAEVEVVLEEENVPEDRGSQQEGVDAV